MSLWSWTCPRQPGSDAGFSTLRFPRTSAAATRKSPGRLNGHEGRAGADGAGWLTKEQRFNQQILTTRPPQVERINRWRCELTGEEVAEFRREAGALLDELGYAS